MIGVNTVLIDNPHLTARGCGGKGGMRKRQPLRLIVDSKGKVPLNAHIFEQPGEVLLAVVEPFDPKRKDEFTQAGAEVLELPSEEGMVNIEELLKVLGKREVVSILVEGGGKLLGSLFDHHLVDKVLAFISPIVIGGKEAKSAVGGNGVYNIAEALRLNQVKIENFNDAILVSGYVERGVPQKS